MKVFISWSGATSHKVAIALRDWLPDVIQRIHPFVSSEDIAKGGRWLQRVSGELDGAGFGLICVTPHSLAAPWVQFEAGALSIKFAEGRVAPLLVGLEPEEVTGPLSQFQGVRPQRDAYLKLLVSINVALGDERLTDPRLTSAFDLHWPKLEPALVAAVSEAKSAPAGEPAPAKRTLDDMIVEALEILRELRRDARPSGTALLRALRVTGSIPDGGIAAAVRSAIAHQGLAPGRNPLAPTQTELDEALADLNRVADGDVGPGPGDAPIGFRTTKPSA